MRIAVIGAGRRRNGIGAYSARFAHIEGAQVVAVLAQDEATARQDADDLMEFGIAADACSNIEQLIDRHCPDAIVIASPATTHAVYLSAALEAGLHVLCEKPFIWESGCDCRVVSHILDAARTRNLTVAMNSQWPFVLPAYEQLCGLPPVRQIESFHMQLAPLSTGRDMIPDAMPHALSLLYSVLGPGALEQMKLEPATDRLQFSCVYVTAVCRCRVSVDLVHETHQPRTFAFGFNGSIVRRTIDMATYRIFFSDGDQRCVVDDPLRLSVRDFLHACNYAVSPRIGSEHILDTMMMLQQVYAAWPVNRPE